MLTELKIRNFAIIDELHVSFTGGLNMLSGETGAGKSIIIGAVSLLLGDRASSGLVRSSADAAVVEALFDVRDNAVVRERLEEAGMGEEEVLLLKRVVSREGRNKVYINGSPATLGMLASFGEVLVNICGQREHQLLLDIENHIDILDTFGGLIPLRDAFTDRYAEWQGLTKKLNGLKAQNDEKLQREELLRFQLDEIDKSDLTVGEDGALQDEKRVLSNAQRLDEYARGAYDTLYAAEGSIIEQLGGVVDHIRKIRKIDPGFAITDTEVESLFFNLEESAFALRDYLKGITYDPIRLEVIEDRLELLARIKRKYGTTIEDVSRKREEIAHELDGIAYLGEEIARVSEEISRREEVLLERAGELSARRKETAVILKETIESEIRSLRMADAVFEVRFRDRSGEPMISSVNPKGTDELEFYLSTNVGEDLLPLNRIASGGELSRIVLAMKKALAGTGAVGTVVFDEVDSGIGGAVAEVVGKKLQDVSRHHQVICITHLPQIACFGDTHFLVSKSVEGERTNAAVDLLSEEDRLDEIARMLSGIEITEKTREHASEMLRMSGR